MPDLATIILLPCHSLEDFPTETTDAQAESLLNAFAAACHPALIQRTRQMPRWSRADEPRPGEPGELYVVPELSRDWLPHGWIDQARERGARVVVETANRDELVAALLAEAEHVPRLAQAALFPGDEKSPPDRTPADPSIDSAAPDGPAPTTPRASDQESPLKSSATHHPQADLAATTLDAGLIADFQSLGVTWILLELLTRQMRHFGDVEESRLKQHVIAAADSAMSGNSDAAAEALGAAFETLLDGRERFFPVDCFQVDLCLLNEATTADDLWTLLRTSTTPVNLWATAHDLTRLLQPDDELRAQVRAALDEGRLAIVGGDWMEAPTSLGTGTSLVNQIERGRDTLRELLGHAAAAWGRRRFGVTPLVPMTLSRLGVRAALHLVIDDGLYPDEEALRFRWQGLGQAAIPATSRIPLSSESPASYLRLPQRLGESMDHDPVAGLLWARLPGAPPTILADLQRAQKFSPVLGEFVLVPRLFDSTERQGKTIHGKPGEYITPFLRQAVARRHPDPITRYQRVARCRRAIDDLLLLEGWCDLLSGDGVTQAVARPVSDALETAFATDDSQSLSGVAAAELETQLAHARQRIGERLISLLAPPVDAAAPRTGKLLVNPQNALRRCRVMWGPGVAPPGLADSIVASTATNEAGQRSAESVIELPPCGFVVVPSANPGQRTELTPKPKRPLAEENFLRNEFFEVEVHPVTGGLKSIRRHDSRSNRLSQSLSFRYLKEQSVAQPGESPRKTHYAETVCEEVRIEAATDLQGMIATVGSVVDPVNRQVLARFTQRFRITRALPRLEFEIELNDVRMPDGDPWSTYFASRIAWNDPAATLTCGHLDAAVPVVGERFETLDGVEIASEDERTLLLPGGLPFHRRSGNRMLDSLLVVAGETSRVFRFAVLLDANYPQAAATSWISPPLAFDVAATTLRSAWLFQIEAPNVKLEALGPRRVPPQDRDLRPDASDFATKARGATLRLRETEGRAVYTRLRLWAPLKAARLRDAEGRTISTLLIDRDSVLLDVSAYELLHLEVLFAANG